MKLYNCHRCGNVGLPSQWIWNNGEEIIVICTICASNMPGDRDNNNMIIYYRETGIEKHWREERDYPRSSKDRTTIS